MNFFKKLFGRTRDEKPKVVAIKPEKVTRKNKIFMRIRPVNTWPVSPKNLAVHLGKLVKVTPGGRHAYYKSNFGLIRKPL